ncbi:uncharacterized protein FOMMEDRAFT_15959 [Fomitiporia mediterranea MF3/22]|uniref:uncharacterized protein n=1 Tax=Fomitiporia mediterranea (strain MF3/22) TaxID=694068 RepID=UPI00044099C5|nr:uncharacterized protein FOMMEDRAFT_15959 [Fomitiporia mediterranea MF3/22]EJD07233.1 hypothetical protein FOMMEDRAFT_15959 [Fomitiporia mediterranea MF3/22]
MTCPHCGARTKPIDIPDSSEKAEGDAKRPCISESEKNLYHQGHGFAINLEDLRKIFPHDVFEQATEVARRRRPRSAKEVKESNREIEACIDLPLRRVLMNISEYNKYSSRGPGCRVAELFNHVGRTMCQGYAPLGTSPRRGFSCRFGFGSTGKGMSDLDRRQKPDLVLVDQDLVDSEDVTWRNVHCPIVVVDGISGLQSGTDRLLGFAHHIFNSQPRNFVLGVVFLGTHFTLNYFDRSGHYSSIRYRLREGNAIDWLLAGFFFADEWQLGHDNSLVRKDGELYVRVNEEEYLVKEELDHHTQVWNMFGEKSIIRVVERDGKTYINKDVWLDKWSNRDYQKHRNEAQMMERICGLENVAQLVNYCTVKYPAPNGNPVSSRRCRGWLDDIGIPWGLIDAAHPELIHHQLIISPYGDNISTFTSLEELVSVFRDITRAIKELAGKGMYHRDVSYGNIVLAQKPDQPSELRTGYLIDFGQCVVNQPDHGSDPAGTAIFMALDVLFASSMGIKIEHQAMYDLESLLYLLCWHCTASLGPKTPYKSSMKGTILDRWRVDGSSGSERCSRLFRVKYTDIIDDEAFETNVLANFQPYFHDLIPCVRELRKLLCHPVYRYSPKDIIPPHNFDEILNEERHAISKSVLTEHHYSFDPDWACYVGAEIDYVVDPALKIFEDTLAMIRRKARRTDDRDGETKEGVVKGVDEDGRSAFPLSNPTEAERNKEGARSGVQQYAEQRAKRKRDSDQSSVDSGYVSGSRISAVETKRRKIRVNSARLDGGV